MSESAKTYSIDPAHSTVRFWIRHLAISKVHGEIPDVTGTVVVDSADVANSSVEASLNLASLTTNNQDRDGHLKSPDFLDVASFPTMTFKSTSVSTTGEDVVIVGDLTLHGVTKSVTLKGEVTPEVKSPFGGYKIGVSLAGEISREDFGVSYNQILETGGVMLGKEIHLQVDAEIDRPE